MTSPAQRVFARSSRSLMNFDMSCGGRLHADSRLNKWDLLMSSVSISRISSISTSIASVGGSYSFCSSSYSHISTASRFRMRLIWCEPYLAVRNFSRRSFTSPFSVKLTRSPVRPGDRSQSFMVSTPHCISPRLLVHRRVRGSRWSFRIWGGPWSDFWKIPRVVFVSTGAVDHVVSKARYGGRGLPKSEWLILIKNFSNFPWTHIQQIDDDDDDTLSRSQNQASSPSFYYFSALLYIFIHTNIHTPAHLKNFTLWKDIYPEFFLPENSKHTHTALLTLYFPSWANCLLSSLTRNLPPIHSFKLAGWLGPWGVAGEDPFYGRNLWLPRRLEIGVSP